MDMEKSCLALDVKVGTTIEELKEMIKLKWRMGSSSFECYHDKRKLCNEDRVTLSRFGFDPTITVFDEKLYPPVCTNAVPTIDMETHIDDSDMCLSNFIIMCSRYPRYEEMIRLLLLYDSELTTSIVKIVLKKVKKHEIDESNAAAYFCSKIKAEIQSFINDF